MRVKKNKKGLVPLDNYLESLAKCGDFMKAAQSAGVSDHQLEQWFNHRDILRMIAEARANAQLRKYLFSPLMDRDRFIAAIKECRDKATKKRLPRYGKLVEVLVNNPGIKDKAAARKLRIPLNRYQQRKKRLLDAFFDQLRTG